MTEHKNIEELVFKFSPKDYFLVYDENDIPFKYSLCGKIDRSYKGKDEDVGCPVVYLDDDEVEKARKMGFTEVAYSTEPHLNSRNLLERLKMKTWKDKKDSLPPHIGLIARVRKEVVEGANVIEAFEDGYDQAVGEINSKLDEFIESELKQ